MSEESREPRGVHNPRVVDLVRLDAERDEVVLLMLEERAWGTAPEQLQQLGEKFNSYLSYVLDGHMVKQYPSTRASACASSSTARASRVVASGPS